MVAIRNVGINGAGSGQNGINVTQSGEVHLGQHQRQSAADLDVNVIGASDYNGGCTPPNQFTIDGFSPPI